MWHTSNVQAAEQGKDEKCRAALRRVAARAGIGGSTRPLCRRPRRGPGAEPSLNVVTEPFLSLHC